MIGVPGEGIGMILGVDRFLDMCRTTLNVTGDLAAAVRKLEDPGLRKSMGEAARRKAQQHPLEKGYREYLKLYEELLAKKSGPVR